MTFAEYIVFARQTVKKDMTDAEIIADYVNTNLRLCRAAVACAERMNWGARVHEGLRTLEKIKPLLVELDSRPLSVTSDELNSVCGLRQALCDLMWRAEHHL